MINPPEPKQPVPQGISKEIQPEWQYVLRYLTRFLVIRYPWYLIFFIIILGLFVFSPYLAALVGLKALLGWQSLYYTSIYRLVY
jgi:hypothetical protein